MPFALLLLLALVGGSFGGLQTASLSLVTCRDGVGLAPFARLRDSRSQANDITCADGVAATTRGISAADQNQLVQFDVVLRPLSRGIWRQGMILRGLFFVNFHIVLVGVCMTDVAPRSASTLDDARMPANMCAGVHDASNWGSPSLEAYLDATDSAHLGWQVKNPPTPTLPEADIANSGFNAACNFYGALILGDAEDISNAAADISNLITVTNIFALMEQSGLGDYVGIAAQPTFVNGGCNIAAAATATSNVLMTAVRDSGEIQKFGSLTSVLQAWADMGLLMLDEEGANGINVHRMLISDMATMGGNVRGITSYAGFQVGQSGAALGFQIRCEPSDVDQTKWLTLTFLGGIAAIPDPVNADWDYNPPIVMDGVDPTTEVPQQNVDSQVGIRITCQNVATDTPTPPLYPRPPAPAPSDAPFPITAGSAGSFVIVVEECTRVCQDLARQALLLQRVAQVALQVGNVGANVRVTCEISSRCSEVLDTTFLQILDLTRRGLRQATSIVWLQRTVIVTRELGTAQYIIAQIRNGNLAPLLNAFSAIALNGFDDDENAVPQVVPAPSDSPITTFPSPFAVWTQTCIVYGNCRAGGCASTCANDAIVKVSAFSDSVIGCLCNLCVNPLGVNPLGAGAQQVLTQQAVLPQQAVLTQQGVSTQYFFETLACETAATQAAADECCLNVMRDVVCWALNDDAVRVADRDYIQGGFWSYRPPAIGVAGPALRRTDGPTDCPDSSSSNKGLLGLLGLLGIIPLLLCCLSLLLCLLRRKKREGDVHFATFDPAGAPGGLGLPGPL